MTHFTLLFDFDKLDSLALKDWNENRSGKKISKLIKLPAREEI